MSPVIQLLAAGRTFRQGGPRGAGAEHAALRPVTVTIGRGQYVAVTGASGSGKSTLLNLVTGVDRASQGSVRVNGTALETLGEGALARFRGTHIGIVFQFFELIPTLTALDNVVLAMDLVGVVPAKARRARALSLLGDVGLADQAFRPPGRLSGGEQQRVAIARALANDPPILVADEPTGNLDRANGERVAALFDRCVADGLDRHRRHPRAGWPGPLSPRAAGRGRPSDRGRDGGGGAMIPVRLKKVARDFGVRWGRTLMAFAGLTIGLFVAGAVVAAYSLLRIDLDAGYRRTNPPNLVLRTDAVAPGVLRRLAALPGVAAMEERPLVPARIETQPGRWWPLELAVVDDFRDVRVATFTPDAGLPRDAWPPATGGLLLERDGRYFMEGAPGGALPLRFADGGTASAAFTGYVFDPGQHPSRMERVLYGYITRATLAAWGQSLDGTRLLLTARASSGPDSAGALAPVVEATLAAAGVAVRRMDIQDVPVYGHQNQLDALLVLMAGLAVTTLVMGMVLVVNLVDGMMTRERRVVGVMRALGARPGQVLRDYLLATGLLGLGAALASLWPALSLGTVMARFLAAGNNFDLVTPRPPYGWLPSSWSSAWPSPWPSPAGGWGGRWVCRCAWP
ncbi:ABC transporter ATP-binding protein [Nitrospirillum sp. BR 11163]|uniref:ABC transporter ATP-binding protein/permease n=1 Tax=Nitrospirillum sp. BR 11163 TaxID=3104323 RepID=UPI002AFE1556|nr:ABC transporter ATP-binding protein [Nitrospirillum sp. BR 11163]MEA1672608.1 ABC transporter ATP-binding protein [Nitrospirillum sp. BR 11163]